MTSKIYTPTERQVWLHSINRIIQTIRITFDILTEGNEKEPKSKTSRRYIVIIGYLIIQLKTFIDEWDLAVDDAEIIAFKKQFAPIVKAIRSYKDISYIRNSLLAH
ncbi:MAG: hypothetical protein Q8R57_13690, partial [Bacteroidota bacterium]|nr:hypothetical protein [Bacteroidota bacterium]